MKKGVLIALVVALVLAIMVPAALALTDVQKEELEALYEKQHQLRQEILDKQVEAGLVNPEDADLARERMDQSWEYRQERMNEGDYNFGPGRRGGRGNGGGGYCPMHPQTQQPAAQETAAL
ncbi:DUF2680 domain-containing protein [Dethiobacter alkaliphilus]|uniref:DUF2680 domain-containing protein n=1 Tax=Dethiobacter alkaliphilus AHT 1 TaxID=555088 RepID=C0GC96_DETAL|nr:DUF2680 domain-containing protein [Dethiobacter alkaliphilus]EEG78831.1 conserved hypothetical protein [Dethiobacter alkaliphilus AHT 1]